MYDVFLHATDNGFIVEYDATESEAPPLLSYLKRHVLRSKVKVRPVTEEFDVWSSWGAEGDVQGEVSKQWQWARSGAVEPLRAQQQQNAWGSERGVLQDVRGVGLGRRILIRKDDIPVQTNDHESVSPEKYHMHRIFHGVPEGSKEIVPMHAFPMESNLDAMGGLDFRKGCYVGQELTVRTYHTGAIRKRILPFHLSNSGSDATTLANLSGEDLYGKDIEPVRIEQPGTSRVRPRGTGKLLSFQGGIGLALMRLEHVAGLNSGELELQVNVPGLGHTKVIPWFPGWWPQPPQEEATSDPSDA